MIKIKPRRDARTRYRVLVGKKRYSDKIGNGLPGLGKPNWKNFKSPADVRSALTAELGRTATIEDVQHFATMRQLEHSAPINDIIYCSAPTSTRSLFIQAKWLIQFHFRKRRLVNITVEKGLAGP